MDIKLNFINRSNDTNNSQVVIFAKNAGMANDFHTLAWRVIDNCGPGDNHPFVYPMQVTVAVSDSEGTFTPQLPARPGHRYTMSRTEDGDQLADSGATGGSGVEIENALQEPIEVYFYRDGRAFLRTSIPPTVVDMLQFEPIIRINAASKITEGQILATNTELSLLGIGSADIVMKDGGPGNEGLFVFSFDNIVAP